MSYNELRERRDHLKRMFTAMEGSHEEWKISTHAEKMENQIKDIEEEMREIERGIAMAGNVRRRIKLFSQFIKEFVERFKELSLDDKLTFGVLVILGLALIWVIFFK